MQKSDVPKIIARDAYMMRVLTVVRSLNLPDWWIGAGFVRNKVWDTLSNDIRHPSGDIDVVYFDPSHLSEEAERLYQDRLEYLLPTGAWSVTNQARMHRENGDAPYTSSLDAIAHWPETATALAVMLDDSNEVIFQAPYGARDLLRLIIRPTPHFLHRLDIFHKRLAEKQWSNRWPNVRIISE